ncbi:hypothetical protein ASE16_03610 [Leifsonia sp. Root227]|uniref:hypothetical protein n=1 Tax=Leifsonia sp. Root227 TaxID=1736496 RepID=UPI0006F31AF4|nr:hypothetical protein [Leifsonia sp. Root227]KRC52148.1 hypothetical protein ASE16_03610 [Leifsonia sp. Root227]
MASQSSIPEQFDSRGFVAGVFRGARSFLINQNGFLTGVVFKQVWTPGVNVAECRHQPPPASFYLPPYTQPEYHHLPEGHGMDVCRHGFYAYAEASDDYHYPGRVSGVIEGWGKEVMLGTRGFRASLARIVALCISEVKIADRDRTALVAHNYPDVPMFNTFDDMLAEFPPEIGENL